MTSESAFIDLLKTIASDPAARGLIDDVAVLKLGGETLIITHDMLIEGVHFRADDPPADVAWKLVSVNMSDLAAKGATPLAVMLGFGLGDSEAWNTQFVAGLKMALDHYGAALIGGDTVAQPRGDARALGLTALGLTPFADPPWRNGARTGDALYVCGAIGDASAGLALLDQGLDSPESLIAAYRRPNALVSQGQALASLVHAMMDVSDGLLIDAARMAAASQLGVAIDLGAVPLSDGLLARFGDGIDQRVRAATGGDDYALLFAADPDLALPVPATCIGQFTTGDGLALRYEGQPVALPDRLGWLHQG